MPSVFARVRIESSESLTELMKQAEHWGLLYPVASHVEPDWRVEGRVLADEDVHEFVVEGGAVFRSAEVALRHAPIADRLGNAGDELADSGFAFGSADLAVEILAGHDVGGGHRPVFRDFDVLLLEDDSTMGVGNLSGAEIPLDFVIGRDARLGEQPTEREAGGLLFGDGWRRGDGRRSGGGFGFGFDFRHQGGSPH
jgi:hypothetical protein